MIEKDPHVDELITKLLSTYPASGSNIKRAPSPFLQEALQLKELAPFLDNSYLYFLSELSVLLLELNHGDTAIIYGLDDWDDGLNILDYDIPDKTGFFLVLDICDKEGNMLYFSYNTNAPEKDIIWTSAHIDGPYTETSIRFIGLLNLICEDNYRSLWDIKNGTTEE